MTTIVSYSGRLRGELELLAAGLDQMLDLAQIRTYNVDGMVGMWPYGWAEASSDLLVAQMRLTKVWTAWAERFELLFPHATPNVQNRVQTTMASIRSLIKQSGGSAYSVPQTIGEAKTRATEWFGELDVLLDLAERTGSDGMFLIPDTNALIRNPDLASYPQAVEETRFTILFVPTVLDELDDLKDRGRTPELREKANRVVRRIKDLRMRGTLTDGVKLVDQISVVALARETPPREVLEWLDPDINDDRILAAALRQQSDNPAGVVVLMTGDVNLQNKASVVGLPYVETPPTDASLSANLVATIVHDEADGDCIRVLNEGPKTAQNLTCTLESVPGSPPPTSTMGPWSIERLAAGDHDQRKIWGSFSGDIQLSASWTDGLGEQSRLLRVELRPSPP